MTETKKNARKGSVVALCAALMYVVLFSIATVFQGTMKYGWTSDKLIYGAVIILVGLLYTFWFVIPLGALLGILRKDVLGDVASETALW